MESLRALVEQQARAAGIAPIETLLQQWLEQPTPGILPRLVEVAVGKRPAPLVIGFGNDALNQMETILAQHGRKLPQHVVSLSTTAQYAASGDDFARDLGQRPDTEYGRELARQWLRHRNAQDTMKAVHRLATLGIVEDYTIDYSASLIMLQLAPKPANDEFYLTQLEEYLVRYTTRRKARELRQQTPTRPKGETLLEKYLGQMLDFSYGVVAKKRELAIQEMHEALKKYGLAEKPDISLAEFCDLYLNSKYAQQRFLPTDTQDGKLISADTLWTYLRYLGEPPDGQGEVKDNVKHLRGACARLLPQAGYQDNPALLVLDGFAILFLENHKPSQAQPDLQARKIGETKLIDGLLGFGKLQEYADSAALTKLARHFAEVVGRYDERTASFVYEVAETLELHLHLAWLREFNASYDNRTAAPF